MKTLKKLSTKVNFEELTPTHPDKRIFLETIPQEVNMRVVDLVTPIGFGQRMLIVARRARARRCCCRRLPTPSRPTIPTPT